MDNIRHVIYLLLENQSFDRMLGCFRQVYPELDGLNAPGQPAFFNLDAEGLRYEQKPTEAKQVDPDPKHEVRFVLEQLQNNNSGFVLDFARNYPKATPQQRQEVMGYYPLAFLPALHTLALNFTICDHWFASLPGPTWPNRFFALTGTSNGQALMPEGWQHPQLATYFNQTQTTIFDRLDEGHVDWKVYYYDFPSSLLLAHQRHPENLIHYRRIDRFFADCSDEPTFPSFCFIEPKYFGADQNDDHPPHNIFKAEKLIADVYNAIRSSPKLWESSLLIINFDEHGGFYDHVPPPAAIPPDDLRARIDPDNPNLTFGFDRLGIRVPALLVSPWVGRRVEATQFDHTSVLRYLIDRWGLGLATLGQRTANAKSISVALRDARRDDTPAFIRVPYTDLVPPSPALEREDSSVHHKALEAFAYFLARELGDAKAVEAASQLPGAWMKLKSALGKAALGAGAKLTSELQHFNENKVRNTMAIVESIIEQARRE